MLSIGIQFFGGRGGGGSGGARGGGRAGGGTSENSRRSLSAEEIRQAEREIDKTAYEKRSNGVWELYTDSKYGIGVSILDETDNSIGGFGRNKVYAVQTWGQAVEDISPKRYFSSLNAAKTAGKEEAKEWLKSVTVRG